MIVARAGRAGTALAAVALGINPASGLLHQTATASYAPIQHVIVVMQSGHSFDNYFGTRPGVNGLDLSTKVDCQPASPGTKYLVCPNHLTADTARSGLSDSLRVTQKSINGGKMNGFVNAQPNFTLGTLAMGYLNGSDLPYYWSLANRFTLFDNFFAASKAGPLANRVEAVAGQDQGITSNAAPAGGFTVDTVFNQLDQKKVPWKYYVQGYSPTASTAATPQQAAQQASQQIHAPVLDMPAIMKADADKVVNSSQYFVDLAKNQLPPVSYVSSTTDSERAPQSPAQGEAFVESLVNALIQSREWNHTLLLLTYDSAGGWYDNALPPTVSGTQLGLRVPAIVVSPYAAFRATWTAARWTRHRSRR